MKYCGFMSEGSGAYSGEKLERAIFAVREKRGSIWTPGEDISHHSLQFCESGLRINYHFAARAKFSGKSSVWDGCPEFLRDGGREVSY